MKISEASFSTEPTMVLLRKHLIETVFFEKHLSRGPFACPGRSRESEHRGRGCIFYDVF
jgi:hypothetical protein